MAISKGKEVKEVSFKKYIGIASVKVLAVNPNGKKLSELYGREVAEPVYTGELEIEGKKVPYVRIDFILQTNEEKHGVNLLTKVSYMLRKEYRFNRDKTKIQVIDKYGRTAWVTNEQYKAKEIPVYSNGPANLDKEYLACNVGEADLVAFLKTYLGIPNPTRYIDGKWVPVDNLNDCEIKLDYITNYFNGDFKEIEEALTLQPNNEVKVAIGVKNTDNGQYQDVFKEVLRGNDYKYDKLKKAIENSQAAGAYNNTEFAFCDLKEYSVEPSNFDTPSDLPFPEAGEKSPWD